jgi:transcription antitermination factor NusA-like protein
VYCLCHLKAAIGVGEVNEETAKKLEEAEIELKETKASLQTAYEEISQLKARLAEQGVAAS